MPGGAKVYKAGEGAYCAVGAECGQLLQVSLLAGRAARLERIVETGCDKLKVMLLIENYKNRC